MKVVLLSTADYRGGAPRAAYRLHDGLLRHGCPSEMYVAEKVSGDPHVKRYEPTLTLPVRVRRIVRQFRIEREREKAARCAPFERTFYADDRTRWNTDPLKQIPDADLIHLHWVAGFLDYGAFFSWLPQNKPLVWTLHDMANFTGGCCYDLGCGRFARECGACPQFGSRKESDLTRRVWRRKHGYYSNLDPNRVHLVTPSAWMASEVKRSSLLSRFRCSVIPYGLDTDVFQPRERPIARDVLGIPKEAKVVLFVADYAGEFRKGFHVLLHTLSQLEPDVQVFLLSSGRKVPGEVARFPHVHFEDISDDRLLSFVYSAADLFVLPSLADNLPNTVLESMACGTPIVGFDVGGVPEMVRPNVTGLLAPVGEPPKLKDSIMEILRDSAKRAEMSANCRRIALAEYNLELQAKRYSEIYESLTKA